MANDELPALTSTATSTKNEEPSSYEQEIEAMLEVDPRRIGQVWREMQEHGRVAEKIRDALDLVTVGTVTSCFGSIDTLVTGEQLTSAPTLASQRASMLRGFLKRHDASLSQATKDRLEDLVRRHDHASTDESEIAKESQELEERDQGLRDGTPGIYVYTLPHYMKHPVLRNDDAESDHRTYLKVGRSDRDVAKRMAQQSTTALPEPIMVLRRYTTARKSPGGYRELEAKMHSHLNAADHNQNRKRGAGKEWFLTHLKFIDSTAELLGLVVDYEYEASS